MKLRDWYAVLGTNDANPDLLGVTVILRPSVPGLKCQPAERPWPNGAVVLEAGFGSVMMRRMRDDECAERVETLIAGAPEIVKEGFTTDDDMQPIVSHLRQTRQMFSLKPLLISRKSQAARVCEQICGHLCRLTSGLIQVHQEGFFDAQGISICPRNPQHRLQTN